MRSKCIAVLLCVLLIAIPSFGAKGKLVVGVPWMLSSSVRVERIEALIQEAYRRVGREVKLVHMPMSRDIMEANEGSIDATALRVKEAVRDYPNLIPVDIPLVTESLVAFTAKKDLQINSWHDLQQVTVGIVRGMVATINKCKRNGIKPYLVNDGQQAFSMLAQGRLDVVFHSYNLGSKLAENLGITVYSSAPLSKNNYYHLLNRKHAALVPKLAKAFEDMLEDGTSARILGKWANLLPELPEKTK